MVGWERRMGSKRKIQDVTDQDLLSGFTGLPHNTGYHLDFQEGPEKQNPAYLALSFPSPFAVLSSNHAVHYYILVPDYKRTAATLQAIWKRGEKNTHNPITVTNLLCMQFEHIIVSSIPVYALLSFNVLLKK